MFAHLRLGYLADQVEVCQVSLMTDISFAPNPRTF